MVEDSTLFTLNKTKNIQDLNKIDSRLKEEEMKRKREQLENLDLNKKNKLELVKEEVSLNKENKDHQTEEESSKEEESKEEESKEEESKEEESKEEDFINNEKKDFSDEVLRNKVLELKKHSDEQPVQRTKEWFELRKTRITASDVASCLRKVSTVCKNYMEEYGLQKIFKHSESGFCNPYANEKDFILKKNGHSEFVDNLAVKWGNKYENAVVSFYEKNFQTQVWEFGLLLHKDICWLACSPDGITPGGKMIEIKCPFRRKINGIPPLYYWIQCQIQLEVCDLEECDYIECNLENLSKEKWLKTPDTTIFIKHVAGKGTEKEIKPIKAKGVLININNNYYYPPAKYQTCEQMIRWAEKKYNKYKKLKPEIEYYRITEYSLNMIPRSREWFSAIKPMLEKTWKKVLDFDMKDYKDYLEKKKEPKQEISLNFKSDKNDVCLLSDDEN